MKKSPKYNEHINLLSFLLNLKYLYPLLSEISTHSGPLQEICFHTIENYSYIIAELLLRICILLIALVDFVSMTLVI